MHCGVYDKMQVVAIFVVLADTIFHVIPEFSVGPGPR